jgi:hypothetical protein
MQIRQKNAFESIFRNTSLASLWLKAHAMVPGEPASSEKYPRHTCRATLLATLARLGRDVYLYFLHGYSKPKGLLGKITQSKLKAERVIMPGLLVYCLDNIMKMN